MLLDAIGQVTGVPETFRGHPEGTRATQMWDSRLQVEFLDAKGAVVGAETAEIPSLPPGQSQQAQLRVAAKGVVGWRYRAL